MAIHKEDIVSLTSNLLNRIEYHSKGAVIKLLLRPLSDMTDEEIKEFIGYEKLSEMYADVSFVKEKNAIIISYGIDTGESIEPQAHRISFSQWSPNEWIWLLKQGFDLFGLIDAGLAINAT